MRTPIRPPLHLAIYAAATLAICGPALADPAYKASDIVAHFAGKNNIGRADNLGRARALCIGTETECAKTVSEPIKPPAAFDLRINFDYNSAHLTPAARANLGEFARALKDPQLDAARFIVEGHTDAMGGEAFNLDLSMRRASAVVEYLAAHGVAGSRLEAKGYGKQKPLVADPMSSENRRVETRLVGQ